MKEAVLKVEKLKKSYDGKVFAIEDINFEIKDKEIVGIIGKNGAGKSTIIKSITGVIPFNGGKIFINGNSVAENPISAKKFLGYVPDVCNAFDRMTGFEYFNFVADVFNVNKETRDKRLEEFQTLFPLGDAIHKTISSYSHGMKQKISIMASLVANPKLWILDEPTTGLDAQTSKNILNYMKKYASKGNAVMFSSHNLNTVEDICDRVIVISGGKIVEDMNISEVKKKSSSLEKYFMEITD